MSCIFVVTGSNKGIGYGIVKSLAQKVQNGMIYLTGKFLQENILRVFSKKFLNRGRINCNLTIILYNV